MSETKINESAVEFVANWRNRSAQQQKRFIVWFAMAFIFTALICISLFSWYQTKNSDRIVNQNTNYIQDSAIQEANHVEEEMNDAVKLIANFANRYAFLTEKNPSASIREKLSIISDKNLFDRIIYIDPYGNDTSLEGTATVSDRAYFQKGIKGISGWEYLEASRVTGRSSIVFYAPIVIDKEIVGVLAGFYERARIDNLFSYELFNYELNTYLLLGNGKAIANSKDEIVTENMLDKLSEKTFNGENDYNEIAAAIADEKRTTITFNFEDNGKTTVGVIVQFASNDWMLLSVLPYDVTGTMIENANRVGIVSILVFIFVFLFVFVLFIILLVLQNKKFNLEMSNASENLTTSFEQSKEQSNIIESLANIYSSVYFFDLTSNTVRRINEHGQEIKDVVPDEGDSIVALRAYLDTFIADDYRKQMDEFLNYDTFADRLKGHDLLSAEYKRKDGGWRRGILVPASTDDEGNVKSVIYAVRQIDTDKQKELLAKEALEDAYKAARIASDAKTTFLSNMSHDIRTPMNAIIGMTAIAAANIENTDKVTDCLKRITSSSKHLLGLINNVLDMSKIESGKVDLNEDEFKISALIDELITLNQPLIKEKNHTLVVKVNNVTHEDVIGDSTRLQQVFTNLLSNAIKYTPDGGRIEISVSEKETNKSNIGWYEVVFKDNGIGMSEEFQKNLFEPFARAKDARISTIQGTGLGMPISKNIIRMMNGDITVKSELNKGSEFTVSFALKLRDTEEIDYDNFIGLPVLVVDDDITACESTCIILNSLKMDSEWVTTGREAVVKAEERHNKNSDYYAIIIDWKMPDMNGIETTREIRKRVGNDIPIIVISSYNWYDIEQEARAAGVNAFLSKPLFKSKIVDLFSDFLGQHKPASENDGIDIDNVDFGGKRILLAEDNEINREVAIELLSMMNIQTEYSENGKLCVEKFAASEPGYYDLIFMDIQMPVMDGYEAAREIRKLSHPCAQSIPIVAMTANAFSTDVRAAFNSGMNGHLAKPIDVDRLVKVLKQYFD